MKLLALVMPLLAGGAKGFLEDPAYLIGVPLLALGVVGLLVVLSPIGSAAGPPRAATRDSAQRVADARSEVRAAAVGLLLVALGILLALGIVLNLS
jgi:hypothetical protein